MHIKQSQEISDSYKFYWDKAIEIYKGRLTINATLILVLVTITGFAFQNKQPKLFLLAASLPLIMVIFDLLVKWYFLTPFMYKVITEERTNSKERLSIIFLDFANTDISDYEVIFRDFSGSDRQKRFRHKFVLEHLDIKMTFALFFILVEILFWLISLFYPEIKTPIGN